MTEELKVFLSDLESGLCTQLDTSLSPEMFGVQDQDLVFSDPVKVQGEVYLAGDELVARLSCQTCADMPCKVCNEETKVVVEVDRLYFTFPRGDVVNGKFDCTELVREAILLELPAFTECNGGKCSQREGLSAYLCSEVDSDDEGEVYRPFADLEIEAVE